MRHFLAHSILPTCIKVFIFGGFKGVKFTLLPQIMSLDVLGERARLYWRSLPLRLITFRKFSIYIRLTLSEYSPNTQKNNEYTENFFNLNNALRI